MKQYFALLPDYLARCAKRVVLWLGVLVGIVFFIVAAIFGLGRAAVPITTAIILVGALEAGYNVYRKERAMRSEVEEHVRLTARLGSYAGNVPDPGPGKQSLTVGGNSGGRLEFPRKVFPQRARRRPRIGRKYSPARSNRSRMMLNSSTWQVHLEMSLPTGCWS